jgi:hypothetical protein
MDSRRSRVILLFFLAACILALATQGRGVIRNDPSRNIYIPPELTMPLQVKAAHNGQEIFFRYRWPAKNANVYHDMLRYQDGAWIRHGASRVGPDPDHTYEDRVTMLVDDGAVPDFARYGGYITVGSGARFLTTAADKGEVKAHPFLGGKLGLEEVQKHLPGTRSDPADWRTVVPPETLEAQKEAGYFLDLWHWRAGRSNPIDASDDQWVGVDRHGDAGKGPFSTNWDAKLKQPRFMFDPAKAGRSALRWEDIQANRVDFDGIYYLSEAIAMPFDPNHPWKNGDVIPRRLLRPGEGSRGDITVHGKARWQEGYWDVTLKRALDTGNDDDKAFREQGLYHVGFAVHRDATGSRWHYVSHPFSLGLGRSADIAAAAFTGDSPPWDQPWNEITLFYPGQVNWPLLKSRAHAGAEQMAAGVPVRHRHNERQLAVYGVEMEFNAQIINRWIWTMAAGFIVLMGLWFGLSRGLSGRKRGGGR